MARLFSAVGIVSYNGYTFPAPFDAEVVATPRRDSAGRAIKYVTYHITIRAVIVPDDPPLSTAGTLVDDNLENIRCRLTKAGGSFRFVGQGLGADFSINDTSSYVDPRDGSSMISLKIEPSFGPFPTLLSWKPIGSNRAVQIVWSCEVTVPECCELQYTMQSYPRALEHNYTLSWDINDEGATTRIVQGRYEVGGFRIGAASGTTGGGGPGSRPLSVADQSWDVLFQRFPQPVGFHREVRRHMSPDHRTMEYVITDTEIPSDNPLFPYMVKMNIHHNLSASLPNMLRSYNTIAGSITIAPGAPRHWSWLAFSKIVHQRLSLSKDLLSPTIGGHTGGPTVFKATPIITDFSINEDIYSRTFSFSMRWRFSASLNNIFRGSGLFKPITNQALAGTDTSQTSLSWQAWTASMREVANSDRGLANMQFTPADDIILTVCDPQVIPTVNAAARKHVPTIEENLLPAPPPVPPQDSSYLDYQLDIFPQLQTNVVKHSKIQNTPVNHARPQQPGDPRAAGFRLDTQLQESQSQAAADHHQTQVRGPSSSSVVITGRGVRIGYPVPIPKVSQIGNAQPVVHEIHPVQKIIGYYFGIPIFAAAWKIVLDLNKTPAGDLMRNITSDGFPEHHLS